MTVKENFVLQSIEIDELKITGSITQDLREYYRYHPILETKWLPNELIPYENRLMDHNNFQVHVEKLVVENKPSNTTKTFHSIILALFEIESHPSTPDFETYRFYIIPN